VFHEELGLRRSAPADHEAWNQFRVGVDGTPHPNIARWADFVGRNVLGLRVDERSHFIDLQTFAGQIAQTIVLISNTSSAGFDEKTRNHILVVVPFAQMVTLEGDTDTTLPPWAESR
jgi:hypothetical protein